MSLRSTIFILATVLSFAYCEVKDAAAQRAGVAVEATPAQREALLQAIVPAYFRGNPEELLAVLSPLLNSASDGQLTALNTILAEQSIPPLDELASEARYTLTVFAARDKLPRPSALEAVVTVRYFRDKLDGVLREGDELGVLSDELPQLQDLNAYRDLLWKMHVYDNELANHIQVATYAADLVRRVPRGMVRKLSDEKRQLLEIDFSSLAKKLTDTRTALHESELELRVRRLKYAVDILAESADLKERFLAAYAVAIDGELLKVLFDQQLLAKERWEQKQARLTKRGRPDEGASPSFHRPALNEPGLAMKVQQWNNRGRELGGDTIEKSLLLFDGLRWWTRGRYGRGPEAFGLLKSRNATRSDETLTAIAMPMQPLTPTLPEEFATKGAIPEYPRRHHSIWSLDDRRLYTVSSGMERTTQREQLSEAKNNTKYFF